MQNHEAPRYAVFSTLPSLHPSQVPNVPLKELPLKILYMN
jgi:hypothetical protein